MEIRFVWGFCMARKALNRPFRRFPARTVSGWLSGVRFYHATLTPAQVGAGEEQIRGSGGSLEPRGTKIVQDWPKLRDWAK